MQALPERPTPLIPPQHLLVPIIGTVCPSDALSYAFWLASVSHAEVTVLRLGGFGAGEATFQKQLAQLHLSHPQIRFHEDSLPEAGDPGVALVRYANARNFSLIVQSCPRPQGLAHSMTATVSEKVLRFAECPVLCVRQAKKDSAS